VQSVTLDSNIFISAFVFAWSLTLIRLAMVIYQK
jgi:hypothetical protein